MGTPLSRCILAREKPIAAYNWGTVTPEEFRLWMARATTEMLELGMTKDQIQHSMVKQRACNLYESQSPGGLMELNQEKK